MGCAKQGNMRIFDLLMFVILLAALGLMPACGAEVPAEEHIVEWNLGLRTEHHARWLGGLRAEYKQVVNGVTVLEVERDLDGSARYRRGRISPELTCWQEDNRRWCTDDNGVVFDEQRLVMADHIRWQREAWGKKSYRIIRRNSLGLTTREETDWDADEKIDAVNHYLYDREGRLLLSASDRDADGISEQKVIHVYGDPTSPPEAAQRVDHWNEAGQLLSRHVDRDGDGVMDVAWKFSYRDDGRLKTVRRDDGIDRVMDLRTTYVYSDDGHFCRSETRDSADALVELREETTDAEGKPQHWERHGPNGELIQRWTRTAAPGIPLSDPETHPQEWPLPSS